MDVFENPHTDQGLASLGNEIPAPSSNASAVAALLKQCPAHNPTPLVHSKALAARAGVNSVSLKDERRRMGLGSFKALGAAYVIAHDAVQTGKADLSMALEGATYVTASAGNHGMSVAAGARIFGADAAIYLSETVSEAFAERLAEKGARVIREGATYEASMEGAHKAAQANGWRLLSDSSWNDYVDVPHRLMEGYLQLADETFEQIDDIPTHIFLQAGVGGFAGAVAAYARKQYGFAPAIIVVEPLAAPALFESMKAGKPVFANGPVSSMGRLDCKEPSLIALKGLAHDASHFMTITEEECASVMPDLHAEGLETTPSGGAGLAGLLAVSGEPGKLGLTADSRVLAFITESL